VDVIDDLDDISDAVCSVVDVAELCRNTHADKRWVRAAENAYVDLQAYVHSLNADRGLYLALVETHERHLQAEASLRKKANGLLSPANQTNTKQHTVTGDDATAASSSRARHEKTKTVPRDGDDEKNHHRHLLSPEAARVALTLRRDFERGGIHLDDRRRATLERASSAVVRHGMAFQRNLVDRDALGFLDATKSELGGLPPSSAAAIAFGTSERARVPLDQRTLGACMRWLESRNARERVYKAAYAGPEANKAALTELLRARAEVAQSLGFESHAAYAVAPLMAGTPEAVRATLRAASDATDDRLAEEAMVMRGFFTHDVKNVAVRSWDRAFLARRAREALNARFKNAAAGEYFGAVAVARGVSRLAERVFGVSLAFQEMLPGEAWCADARKLVARDAETNEALGVIYLDVVARPGKFPHAAHFVARCGRERGKDPSRASRRTLPSVALVCNFGGHPGTTFEDTHLTHSELETFMHELGHAMHSILSRTEYQHLSGRFGGGSVARLRVLRLGPGRDAGVERAQNHG
jgi:intermediate peptidase